TSATVTATETSAPVTATETSAPVTATETSAPVTETSAPVTETSAPVTATETSAPVSSTEVPVTTEPVSPSSSSEVPVTTATIEPSLTPTSNIVIPTTDTVVIPTTVASETQPILTQTTESVTMISGTIVPIGRDTNLPGPNAGDGGNGLDGSGVSKNGLSQGATVGVVVGSLAALALIAGVFFIMFRRQSRRLQNPNSRFVSRAASGAGAAGAGGDLGHLYSSRQPEGSGSHGSYGSVRNLPGGAPVAGHIVVAPEMMEHPANRSNLNLHSGPMAFGTSAAIGASSGLAGVHAHDGYHESSSDGREISSSYGASGGSGAAGSAGGGGSGGPFGTASGSMPTPSGGTGSPHSQQGSIHYI
ncbi:hypothetical protein BX616_008444, partial [Lobosporangium transversale]